MSRVRITKYICKECSCLYDMDELRKCSKNDCNHYLCNVCVEEIRDMSNLQDIVKSTLFTFKTKDYGNHYAFCLRCTREFDEKVKKIFQEWEPTIGLE